MRIWYYNDRKIGTRCAQLVQAMAQHPVEAIELALQFAQFVRQRQRRQLDPWLEQAQRALSPFNRFANACAKT